MLPLGEGALAVTESTDGEEIPNGGRCRLEATIRTRQNRSTAGEHHELLPDLTLRLGHVVRLW